jgi:hypothetical protein
MHDWLIVLLIVAVVLGLSLALVWLDEWASKGGR